MKLEKIAKKSLKFVAGAYAMLVIAEAGLESYYIARDKINSTQSYEVVRSYFSYNKNIPDIVKTLFVGTIIAHTVNLVSDFGETKL